MVPDTVLNLGSAMARLANASGWTLHSNQPLRRFALLLHGSLDRRKKYVATCAASQLAMIVHANDADGGVDVYIHSWDAQRYPGTLPTIHGVNAAYGSALRASLHEPSVADLPRGASQALSIARGAVLAEQLAHAAGHSYERPRDATRFARLSADAPRYLRRRARVAGTKVLHTRRP